MCCESVDKCELSNANRGYVHTGALRENKLTKFIKLVSDVTAVYLNHVILGGEHSHVMTSAF